MEQLATTSVSNLKPLALVSARTAALEHERLTADLRLALDVACAGQR